MATTATTTAAPWKRKKNPRAWTPFQSPTLPPPGSYDPAFDAQEAAANRGLEDFKLDYSRDYGDPGTQYGGRVGSDYLLSKSGLTRSRDRAAQDIGTSRAREAEDYGLAGQMLNRRYGIQASNQAQAANQAGVLGGGWAAQAARKRAENQRLDQDALDLSHRRSTENYDLAGGRLGEDFDTDVGKLDLGYSRATQDASTGLTRAIRENTQFGLDVGKSRWFASGYEPPEPPKGEGQRAGVHYRRQGTGKGAKFLLTSGRTVSRSELLKKIARAQAKRRGA